MSRPVVKKATVLLDRLRSVMGRWITLGGDAARLMVGVGSYSAYCDHMRLHHPQMQPMSEAAFFRHCQQSRYPANDGKIKKCPC